MASNTRRTFIKSAAIGAATTCAAPAIVRGSNLNSKIRVVVVGMGGRASSHTTALVELEKDPSIGVELAGICDCDSAKLGEAVKVWGKRAGHALTAYDDMRRVLDDKSVDAVTFATPNHWHALGTIWSCQAGKDVYVEKPGSHNIFEGRKMVEAARKTTELSSTVRNADRLRTLSKGFKNFIKESSATSILLVGSHTKFVQAMGKMSPLRSLRG